MIDVTKADMVEFVKKVYELSRPQGMGMMHFKAGGLTDEEAKAYIKDDGTVSMDYVSGRACKMHVRNRDGILTIPNSWYDHSDEQLKELLDHVGIITKDDSQPSQHSMSCNCDVCRVEQNLGKLDVQKDFESCKQAHRYSTAFNITGI